MPGKIKYFFITILLTVAQGCSTVQKPSIFTTYNDQADYEHADGIGVIVANYQYKSCKTCPVEQRNMDSQRYLESCIKNSLNKKIDNLEFVENKPFLKFIENASHVERWGESDWYKLFENSGFKKLLQDYSLKYLAVTGIRHTLYEKYDVEGAQYTIGVNKHTDIDILMETNLYDVEKHKLIGSTRISQTGTKNSGMAIFIIIPIPWIGFDFAEDSICHNTGIELYKMLTNKRESNPAQEATNKPSETPENEEDLSARTFPFYLTGDEIETHFSENKTFSFDKARSQFSMSMRSKNNIERYCSSCTVMMGFGSMRVDKQQNVACFNWDNVSFPSSSCFKVIKLGANRFLLVDPVDNEHYEYKVEN